MSSFPDGELIKKKIGILRAGNNVWKASESFVSVYSSRAKYQLTSVEYSN